MDDDKMRPTEKFSLSVSILLLLFDWLPMPNQNVAQKNTKTKLFSSFCGLRQVHQKESKSFF